MGTHRGYLPQSPGEHLPIGEHPVHKECGGHPSHPAPPGAALGAIYWDVKSMARAAHHDDGTTDDFSWSRVDAEAILAGHSGDCWRGTPAAGKRTRLPKGCGRARQPDPEGFNQGLIQRCTGAFANSKEGWPPSPTACTALMSASMASCSSRRGAIEGSSMTVRCSVNTEHRTSGGGGVHNR